MSAVAGRRDAARTVADFELDREGLRRGRRLLITNALLVLEHCVELCREGQQERALRLARPYFESLRDPKSDYSAAASECFLRAWVQELPGVPLPGRRR